ncbi:MAG: hypothetical protein HRU13_11735 [Phycisphaerales bacterium]|nr:hypothetical protein [Phycisphaerales bacterium]
MRTPTPEHAISPSARLGLLAFPPTGTPPQVRRVCRRFVWGGLVAITAAPLQTLGRIWLPDQTAVLAIVALVVAPLGVIVAVRAFCEHQRLMPTALPTADEG